MIQTEVGYHFNKTPPLLHPSYGTTAYSHTLASHLVIACVIYLNEENIHPKLTVHRSKHCIIIKSFNYTQAFFMCFTS
jgi:hypothetical protein